MTEKTNPVKKPRANKAPAKETIKHPLKFDGKDFDRQKTMLYICERIATTSYGIAKVLREEYTHTDGNKYNLPDYSTIMQWMIDNTELSEIYAKAKEDQCDYMADEIVEISDSVKPDAAEVQRARLRVDARKWVAAKLKPRKYGDKVQVAGDQDNPLQHNVTGKLDVTLTPDEVYKRLLNGN